MMKIYARIEGGVVVEIIQPWAGADGVQVDIPIEDRFTPEFVATLVDITDLNPMPLEQWLYDGSTFEAPTEHQPTPEEIIQKNTSQQNSLIYMASLAMAPVLVSLQLGDPTDDETVKAKAWQSYYRDLKLVDLTVADPAWPIAPE
ncbi:tail fiber assembly protein [Pseudomonas sp. 681]|jgi:hypothetical protein|uniref:Tail fiber assembly protein n=1 Tax=Pseudomonas fungipugnans TaxID=3024217 RepID=A0ABT6QW34_9PSED|nr:tail fiber assembly protein [Pseudomonas sp. 681]MDI2595036.1 tail fiber assembly protein [Pseudomonas sp. 681]